MTRKIVQRLANIPYVRAALAEEIDLKALRIKQPTPRMMTGIILIGLSYILGWPAVATFGLMAVYFEEPLLAAIGGPAIYGFSYLVFFAGAWLAGADYAKLLMKYLTKLLFRRFCRNAAPAAR